MTGSGILQAGDVLISAMDAACTGSLSDAELIDAFRDSGTVHDQVLTSQILMAGELIRTGVFTNHGYTRPEYAIAQLLGWDLRPARRRVKLAQQICPRVTLDGQPLPAMLPATATVFAEGRVNVGVAEAIVEVLNGPAALRLPPHIWAGVEEQVAHYAATNRVTPNEITSWARQLIEAYDQDGPEPRPEPEQVNELHMTRKPGGTGGYIRGELDGPTFEAVQTTIGALSKTRTTAPGQDKRGDHLNGPGDSEPLPPHPLGLRAAQACADTTDGAAGYVDERTLPQRQADALAELCGFALRYDHTLPDTGGERPHIRVTIDLERLRNAVAGTHLDTGAWYSPPQLRMLACEAFVIPAVMGGNADPLDIGRATRTVPTAIRRAVAIRDRGCSFPGCNRPPAWCDVHHCVEWADGGDTAVHNCTMLCRHHHTIIHQSKWAVRIHEGHPEFIPPEFLDPLQRIRRKTQLTIV